MGRMPFKKSFVDIHVAKPAIPYTQENWRYFVMRYKPLFFGIHARPPGPLEWILPFLIPVMAFVAYDYYATAYLDLNPQGKLLPSFNMIGHRIADLAFTLDPRAHVYLLWSDTFASLVRFFTGLSLAAVVGLLLGMNMALFPGMRLLLLGTVVALSFIPMVAMLPVLLIALGIGEEAKIMLIFLGLVFFITRDMDGATRRLPQPLLDKARTLGASELALVYRIVFPMILPRLLESIRLNLGPAWLFLITGEAIAASQGMAYRIFLFRRVGPDMAGIITYVAWIGILSFTTYYLVLCLQNHLCGWERSSEK